MPDLQADVPHEREEPLEIRLPRRGLALRQQHHDVDVGAQVQLAAAVTADRDQRELAHVLAEVLRPRGLEQRIDEARAIAHQPFDRLVIVEALLEAVVAFGERTAERGNVGLIAAQGAAQAIAQVIAQSGGQPGEVIPAGIAHGSRELVEVLGSGDGHGRSGGPRLQRSPAPSVSTS